MSYGYNKDNSINSKKKNAHKSSEHFEKEKKTVRKFILIHIIIFIVFYIFSCKKRTF